MDWGDFFERTRTAAQVESFSKLAPLLGITDGAIGHYRQGRRVPQVWVVAEALKIQGHPQPEREAINIMKAAALTSPERVFWKRLSSATAAIFVVAATLLPGVGVGSASASAETPSASRNPADTAYYVKRRAGKWLLRLVLRLTTRRRQRHAYLLALQG